MIAFGVVMRQVLPDHMLQGAFAEQDELLHAFRLDGLHEPLRKRIQVRGMWRKFHDRDTGGVQNPIEGLGVFGVAVVNQIAGSDKFPLPPGHIPGRSASPTVRSDSGSFPRERSERVRTWMKNST